MGTELWVGKGGVGCGLRGVGVVGEWAVLTHFSAQAISKLVDLICTQSLTSKKLAQIN